MAKELLPDQELCEGRYVVLKLFGFGDAGGVYLVKRTEDNSRWVMKEFIPSADLSDEELERRVTRFQDTMGILTAFDHPNLSKIAEHFSEGRRQYVVMERVEGITLGKLTEMSVKPHPEAQVMEWALILCYALHYMHDRPKPFIFGSLDVSNIMITPESELKVINYGLDRFFLDDDLDEFATSAAETAKDVQRFGETMVLLLTKEPPGPLGLTEQHSVSPELAKVINRCLTGDPRRTYSSFEEVSKYIERVLNPPPPVETVVTKKTWFKSARWDLTYHRLFQAGLWKFMRQPIWLVAVEFVVAVVMLWGFYAWANPAVERRTDAAAYVACGDTVVVVRLADRKLLTRIYLPEAGVGLATTPGGDRVFVSVIEGNRLLVYNSITNRMLGFIEVDQRPRQMVVDPRGEFLFVLHPDTGQVGMVQLSRQIPPANEEDRMVRLKDDRLISIVAAGRRPEGLSLDADLPEPPPVVAGEEPAELPPELQEGRVFKLFVSDREDNQLSVFEPNPPKRLALRQVPEPGAQVLTSDYKTLFVASPGRDRIVVFDVSDPEKPKQRTVIDQIGGREPVQLLLRPDADELWSVNASGTLGVINLEQFDLRKTVELQGRPSGAAFLQGAKELELWVALQDKGEIAVVDPQSRIVDERISVGGVPSSVLVVK